MRKTVRRPRSASSMDSTMTPMIDVIFQLQIFFLCTMGFAAPESILPTNIPNTGGSAPAAVAADLEMVKISLRGDPKNFRIELNRQPVANTKALLDRLKVLSGASKEIPVILDIGPEVYLGSLVEVYDLCLGCGLQKINFAATKSG